MYAMNNRYLFFKKVNSLTAVMKYLFITMITTGSPPLDRNPEVTRSRVEEQSAGGLLNK